MRGSPGARAYYQQLHARGTGHQAALRQLGNRLVGNLHGCPKTGSPYNESAKLSRGRLRGGPAATLLRSLPHWSPTAPGQDRRDRSAG
jgi:hypothetical protein